MLTSAPPELPGLIAASVWIRAVDADLVRVVDRRMTIGRRSAETMPAVTVDCSPYGEPTATTAWPTSVVSEEPTSMVGRSETPSALMRAVSVLGRCR